MKKVTFFINGAEISTDEGNTILQAALENGIDIPHFCYHPALGIDGNCRICLVEIEGNPKLVTSCTTPTMDGMKVLTDSIKVKKGRAGILEFILLNHPLDCPVCDKAGECILQNYSYEHGYSHSRLEYPKEHFPVKDLGPDIYLWTERCIKCSRCERFLDRISETGELGFFSRSVKTELDVFPGKPIDNPISLNIVDICPVGALLDKDFLYQARVWDMKRTESVCPTCSTGCNIEYWDLDNRLKRITPRHNEFVNIDWICNNGRRSYKLTDKEDRLTGHKLRGKKISLDEGIEELINTIEKTVDKYGNESIAAIGSPWLTNEENYLIRRIFGSELGAKLAVLPARIDGKDIAFNGGFTIRAEKAPNMRGARIAMGLKGKKGRELDGILQDIKSGKIKCVVVFNGDPLLSLPTDITIALRKAWFFAVCETVPGSLSRSADLVFAGNLPAEKDGTFTNYNEYTQRIRQAVFKPMDSQPEWKILLRIAERWNKEIKASNPPEIYSEMAKKVKFFRNSDFNLIGSKGIYCKE
jgi:NADH-quinone oxidoreductase subunit G